MNLSYAVIFPELFLVMFHFSHNIDSKVKIMRCCSVLISNLQVGRNPYVLGGMHLATSIVPLTQSLKVQESLKWFLVS